MTSARISGHICLDHLSIFTKLGFTYTGSFFNEPILDNVYLIANNSFRYPTYPTSIDTYGEAKATSATGSFQNILLTNNVSSSLPFNSKTYDYNNVITPIFQVEFDDQSE